MVIFHQKFSLWNLNKTGTTNMTFLYSILVKSKKHSVDLLQQIILFIQLHDTQHDF